MTRTSILLLCGGRSAEHEVSLLSARNVCQALDPKKYSVTVCGIARDGHWYWIDDVAALVALTNPTRWKMADHGTRAALIPVDRGVQLVTTHTDTPKNISVDVVFPVLHGPYGEDGTIQGFCKVLGLPCVGASVIGSAVGMDKDVMKRLFREAGIPIGGYVCLRARDRATLSAAALFEQLGVPLFVKPANMGSSVGVHKVTTATELSAAVDDALQYDRKVLIEAAIVGREIECSVLGGDTLRASVPGEVVNQTEFYSYDAKYVNPHGAKTVIPADLTPAQVAACQALAVRVCEVLECDGMARVDCFLARDGQFLVNEINTLPGFTNISMYPKMWEASGLTQAALVDELVRLAQTRFTREQALKAQPDAASGDYSA